MFGTFESEFYHADGSPRTEEVKYGLVQNIRSFDPTTVQFAYLKYVLTKAKETPGVFSKLKVLLMGPGYNPAQPKYRLGNPDHLPKIDPTYEIFNPKASWMMKAYAFVVGTHSNILFEFVFVSFFMNTSFNNELNTSETEIIVWNLWKTDCCKLFYIFGLCSSCIILKPKIRYKSTIYKPLISIRKFRVDGITIMIYDSWYEAHTMSHTIWRILFWLFKGYFCEIIRYFVIFPYLMKNNSFGAYFVENFNFFASISLFIGILFSIKYFQPQSQKLKKL